MTHSQRCIDSNRFGDGFDCICDEEPLPRALKRVKELEAEVERVKALSAEVDRLSKALEAADKRHAQLEADLRSKYTFNPVHYAEYGSEDEAMSAATALAKNSEMLVQQGKRIEELESQVGVDMLGRLRARIQHLEESGTQQGLEIMTQQICLICRQTGHDDREHRDEMIVRLHNDNREINETHLTRIRELEAKLAPRVPLTEENSQLHVRVEELETQLAAKQPFNPEFEAEIKRLATANNALTEENNALVQQVAMLRAYQRKTDEAIRSVALFIEAVQTSRVEGHGSVDQRLIDQLQHWLRRGIVRIVRGDPRPAPCPECKITGGHKLSCSQAPEPIRRMHAKAKAGTLKISYAGRDTEIEYLREAIEREQDPSVRQRMQNRLDYVESKTDAELMANFLEPDEPEGPTQ